MTMNAAHMHALACQYAQERTREHLDAALEACLDLCALIARRFSGRGVEYDDLYQTACLACVSALNSFDPEKGFKFTTYVTPTATGAVRNYLRDRSGLLHTPRALRQQGSQLAKAREAFYALHHEEPSPRQLAEALNWDMAQVLSVLAVQAAGTVASLEQEDEDGLSLADRLPALEAGFERTEQRADLQKALSTLTETENELLRLRFSLNLSQRDTAKKMNRTQMQISRMERRILAALRKELNPET